MNAVLAAVDGSPHSLKGVAFAAELARALGAPLELVYVSFPNLLPPDVYAAVVKEIDAAELTHARSVFEVAEQSLAGLGLSAKTTRLVGAPADAIADHAAATDAWGVVVGARGRSAFGRVMLGSVADRLAHICTKPTVVVP